MPILIEVDADELEGLAIGLRADGRIVQQAARAAANRAVRWARVQLARRMSSRLSVPARALASRFKVNKKAGARSSSAQLWIGLTQVNAARLRTRKTRAGLKAGERVFAGAFIGKGKYGGRVAMRRIGRDRLPVEAVALNLLDPARSFIASEAWPGVQARFVELYVQEIEKRLNK